jgi:hypothetical protein
MAVQLLQMRMAVQLLQMRMVVQLLQMRMSVQLLQMRMALLLLLLLLLLRLQMVALLEMVALQLLQVMVVPLQIGLARRETGLQMLWLQIAPQFGKVVGHLTWLLVGILVYFDLPGHLFAKPL